MTWQEGAVTGAAAGGLAGVAIGTAFDGPGWVVCGLVGLTVGAGIGAIASLFMPGDGNGGAEEAMREYYAGQIMNETNYGLSWAHTNAHNTGTIIPDTQLYLARNAEWAAKDLYDYQTANGLSHVYNASYVMGKSLVCNGTLADIWQTAYNYQSVLNLYTDLTDQFTGTYSSMSWSYDGGEITPGGTSALKVFSPSGTAYGKIQLGMTIPITSTNNFVQVSNRVPIEILTIGSGASTLHITADNGNVTNVQLTGGAKTIQEVNMTSLGLASGRYSFTVPAEDNARFEAFGIIQSDALSNNPAYPALMLTHEASGQEMFDYLTVDISGGIYIVQNANMVQVNLNAQCSNPTISVSDTTLTASLRQALIDLSAANSEGKNLTSISNSYAQTYYNQVVAANGNIPTPWADIVMPDPDQLANMNDQQLIAMYHSYLIAMKSWFNTSHILTYDNITISAESANLLVRGSVYNPAGHMIVANRTVFTPYLTLSDAELKLGWNNITQPGFLETWYNANTITAATQTKNMTYIEFGTGWKMHIDEIYYQNESVQSVNLTIHTWDFVINQDLNDSHPPSTLTDLQWIIAHWYYIAAIAGVICLLAAVATRNMSVLVVGAILLIAAAGGWYLSGDHSILSWAGLNIEKLNLWGK